MNGMIANEVTIAKIARSVNGMRWDVLTGCEKSIVQTLVASGWVEVWGDSDMVLITEYGKKFGA